MNLFNLGQLLFLFMDKWEIPKFTIPTDILESVWSGCWKGRIWHSARCKQLGHLVRAISTLESILKRKLGVEKQIGFADKTFSFSSCAEAAGREVAQMVPIDSPYLTVTQLKMAS